MTKIMRSYNVYVKGDRAQGSRPSTFQFVAWVGNGIGFIPWTPYVEGDEIKSSRGRLGDNLFFDCPLIS
jgi:hypothetical protein